MSWLSNSNKRRATGNWRMAAEGKTQTCNISCGSGESHEIVSLNLDIGCREALFPPVLTLEVSEQLGRGSRKDVRWRGPQAPETSPKDSHCEGSHEILDPDLGRMCLLSKVSLRSEGGVSPPEEKKKKKKKRRKNFSLRSDLNERPLHYKCKALTPELHRLRIFSHKNGSS